MACERGAGLVSRLAGRAAAITAGANKRGFYAGVAVGAGAILGASTVALARQMRRVGQKQPVRPSVPLPKLPQLAGRQRVQTQANPGSGERCARCGASGASKKGGWYRIENRGYCQDCAPAAAQQAGVELAAPREAVTPGTGAGGQAQTISTRNTPSLSRMPRYLPPEKRVPVRLQPASIRLNVGQLPNGQPAWYTIQQGHVVLRTDGRDTGLALTPAVQIGQLQEDGTQAVREDTGQWMITHIPSGRSLGNRAFGNLETARVLAGILAQVDWTRDERQITDREVSQVTQTFDYYNQALEQERQRRGGAAGEFPRMAGGASDLAGDLSGQLVADNVGGVARVLEDKGDRLFVADSYGQRYEINRSEVRQPGETDFRLGRIAMPLDPAHHTTGTCRRCGAAAAGSIGPGTWYRMDYQTFCPACAGAFAEQEGYELPEAVGSLVG